MAKINKELFQSMQMKTLKMKKKYYFLKKEQIHVKNQCRLYESVLNRNCNKKYKINIL